MSNNTFLWILYNPIGALLGRGEASSAAEAQVAAEAMLLRLRRRRGALKVYPKGREGIAYPKKSIRSTYT